MRSAREVRGRRIPHRLCSAALAVGLGLLCLASAAPATFAQEPVFRLGALADTTVAPGVTMNYLLQISNVGSADAIAPADPTCDPNNPPMDPNCVVLTVTLPGHVTALSMSGIGFDSSTCTNLGVPGPTVVSCGGAPPTLQTPASGGIGFVAPTLTVSVDSEATGTLTSRFEVSGGGTAAPADTVRPVRVTATPPDFGIAALDGQVTADAAGTPFTQAAGHPYAASTSFDLNTVNNPDPLIGELWPVEPVKDLVVDLPPGFVGNPTVADTCTMADLANSNGPDPRSLCSPTSQVGTVLVRVKNLPFVGGQYVRGPIPFFSVVPPTGVPARFGFNFAGVVVTLDAVVRSGGDYGLSVSSKNISELAIAGTTITLWGVPAAASHDLERACPNAPQPWQPAGPTCSSGAPLRAFLRNPTSCTPDGIGLPTTAHADSWVHPARINADGFPDLSDPNWKSTSFVTHVPPAYPSPPSDWGHQQGPTGCDKVPFDPKLDAQPEAPARAGAPSGFTFDLSLPQSDDPNAIDQADLKKAVVTLPQGVRVSPSAANGLGACSQAEIALDSAADPSCPGSSKVGSLTIKTPLLADPLTGSIYLATPHQNKFGSLISIYLVARGPGVIVKLPGKVDADPHTGQLTATFDDNPQLPFSSLHLAFDGGPRASLVTPRECGIYTTHALLTSWSGKTVSSDSTFALDQSSDGSPCSPLGFSPGFTAGTENPIAGKDTSFLLRLTRGDRDQELSALTVQTPTGLLGRIANTVLCPTGAASAGTCQDVSKVGTVAVGAGAGASPFYITSGRAYITGPYKGAPYGLSIVVPAVAGPFDLGNVVVRAAIFVDRATAALRVVSDPLPTILEGIPLDVRDVRVAIDKPHFIINPTSCAVKRVSATIGSTAGATAHASSRFQVGECDKLRLAPKLTLTVGARHRTKAGISTPLTATLTQTRGQTGLHTVSVALPGTLNARLPVVNRACSLAAFQAGHCTSRARAGSAVAVTPLLRDPLRGSAYFVRNPKRVLPDLMVALRGQIAIDLTGKISIPGGKRLATRFDTIPDAPITKFTLRLVAGTNGPLGIASNLCSAKSRAATAAVGFRGQNGKLLLLDQRLRVRGCPRSRASRSTRRR